MTAITDYLVALETAIFAVLIWRAEAAASDLRTFFVIFFAATAAAAAAGGTVHGFFEDRQSAAKMILWRTTLVALGLAAYSTWAIGATLLLSDDAARVVKIVAAAIAIGYTVVVVAIDDRFWIAVAHYLPPVVFLFVALAAMAISRPGSAILTGLAGMTLTLVAAIVQLKKIALHARYFNHNVLYHVIQAVALFLIFQAAAELIST